MANYPFQSYFCGQGSSCVSYQSTEGLRRAKYNVERFYKVVGVLERIEDTLKLIEKHLPKVFAKNISRVYTGKTIDEKLHAGTVSHVICLFSGQVLNTYERMETHILREDMKNILRDTLHLEYEFYE